MPTLHSCWPGDSSSKGCLVKQREQAKSAVVLLILMYFYIVSKKRTLKRIVYDKTIITFTIFIRPFVLDLSRTDYDTTTTTSTTTILKSST